MNLQDFESQYRNNMTDTLNELQTAMLMLAQVQKKIYDIGNSVQHLSQNVEEFIDNQKTQS
jgi:UTP-glucose-1-phosphate uridylyltransferase